MYNIVFVLCVLCTLCAASKRGKVSFVFDIHLTETRVRDRVESALFLTRLFKQNIQFSTLDKLL